VKRKIWKRLAFVLMLSVVITATPYQSYATQSTRDKLSDAQKQRDAAKGKVDEQKKEVDTLNGKKAELKKELNGLNDDLTTILGRIDELDGYIADKEQEIDETLAALAEAKATEENQYESMKKRIQFMYKDSRTLYMEIMFKAKTFSDFITLSDYVDSLAEYDRNKFEEFKATRIAVEELEAKLEGEKQELDLLKAEAEEKKAEVMVVIDNTKVKVAQYSDLIDTAEAELLEYEKELEARNADVASIQKQLEEELRMSQLAASSYWRDISEVSFDDTDRYMLAVLIYCEAGGEPYEGQVAVGAVVINRVLSSVYPNTMGGVIYQKYQFSPVLSGRFDYYLSIGKTTQSCYNAADAAMSGVTNVGNCLHFRTPIEGLSGTQIGHHIFY